MGLKRNRYDLFWVALSSLFMLFPSSIFAGDAAKSFSGFLHHFANNSLPKPRTGVLYNISLPANFSGIQVSYLRMRSGSLWARGGNLNSVFIPPRAIPMPYVKRVAIVYENLGNWSSYYYQVPGYRLVAPVIGFTVYDSANSSTVGNQKLHLRIMGDPISVKFPQVVLEEKNMVAQCVKFEAGGDFVLKNMTQPNLCSVTGEGHFSLVIPTPTPPKKKDLLWKWWVLRLGAGLIGLAFLGVVFVAIWRSVRKRNMRKMERESEKGVVFDTVWIGKSKMPIASMIRTQPSLENSYVP